MKAAADSNTFKACFKVAVIYFAVEGMTSRGFSDSRFLDSEVHQRDRRIRDNSLTAALKFVSNSVLHRGTLPRCRDRDYR